MPLDFWRRARLRRLRGARRRMGRAFRSIFPVLVIGNSARTPGVRGSYTREHGAQRLQDVLGRDTAAWFRRDVGEQPPFVSPRAVRRPRHPQRRRGANRASISPGSMRKPRTLSCRSMRPRKSISPSGYIARHRPWHRSRRRTARTDAARIFAASFPDPDSPGPSPDRRRTTVPARRPAADCHGGRGCRRYCSTSDDRG